MESDVSPRNGLDVEKRAEEEERCLKSGFSLSDISLGWRRRYYSALIESKMVKGGKNEET